MHSSFFLSTLLTASSIASSIPTWTITSLDISYCAPYNAFGCRAVEPFTIKFNVRRDDGISPPTEITCGETYPSNAIPGDLWINCSQESDLQWNWDNYTSAEQGWPKSDDGYSHMSLRQGGDDG
jgi:hypothetical protein